jgi:histidinol phosphatase-like PHP family hydrolase
VAAADVLTDLNSLAGGLLGDMAAVQTDRQKAFGYKRAAAIVLSLEQPLESMIGPDGTLAKIKGLGPSSTRIILEAARTGESPSVESAVERSGKAADVVRRRSLRARMLSRATVRRVLAQPAPGLVALSDYRGDLQMHSDWSDGVMSLPVLARACASRGYEYSAVTDHAAGLPIARGMSSDTLIRQHDAIDALNSTGDGSFQLLKGIEANINAEGDLDVTPEERARLDIVLAAPHSRLRVTEDQTARLIRALETPAVHILAHPRGRMSGARAGIVADWPRVFGRAAALGVAIEIDGDPSRQDLDYVLAAEALRAGCLFALDSDAHSPAELVYAETAVAHARLAGIPPARIVNCWPLRELRRWSRERRRRPIGRAASNQAQGAPGRRKTPRG